MIGRRRPAVVAATITAVLGATGARASGEGLGERVLREPGVFERAPDGKVRFVPEFGPGIEVANGGASPSHTLYEIPVEAVGRVETAPDGTLTFRLASTEPNALLKWWGAEKTSLAAGRTPSLVALREAFQTLDATFVNATVGVEAANAVSYMTRLESVVAAAGRAALETPKGAETPPTVVEAARRAWAQMKSLKALYGRDDVYHPHVFLGMFEHSRGGVALADRAQDKVFGSGVLVGNDLVLTCRHCLYRDAFQTSVYAPDELVVRFDYESGPAGAGPPVTSYPVLDVVAKGETGDGPDYALLRIGPGPDGALPQPSRIQRLSKTPARLDDVLYVVGHPAGRPRSIADNGFVLFPFEVDERTYEFLAARAKADTARESDGGALWEAFVSSYVVQGDVRRYRSVRQGGRPTIGADCDTFHGNSGSGVFLKRSHALVGIVYAGEPDEQDEPWVPGWRRHESIVPTVAILADLERLGGAATLGVAVE